MNKYPFTIQYYVNLLLTKQAGASIDRLGATLFNSKIKLTPHQIQASLFAFKNPINNGVILADEVGLGKTIEAGIIIAQLWNEKNRKILIVTPASLMRQWQAELLEKFNLPSIIMDRKNYNSLKRKGKVNPFAIKNQIVICSYQMCSISKDEIKLANFDRVIIDEAHKLRNVWTGKNIISGGIKEAISDTKKILLTATPIQNNVMDLYGLTTLIDENYFGDIKIYREKYIKNYSYNLEDLKLRLNPIMHRTLREQVKPYIRFTKRIPKTFSFTQNNDEIEVYNSIRELLLNSDEESYLIPNKQKHLLTMILCKLMGSSIYSIIYTLETMKKRLENLLKGGEDYELEFEGIDDEYDDINDENVNDDINIDPIRLQKEITNLTNIIDKAKKIKIETKYNSLKESLSFAFKHLQKLGANKKVLIFTESRRTQEYLYNLLINDGYKNVLQFNGSNSDEVSKEIYDEWCLQERNSEKLNNSKSVNMRQAIIDKFAEDGEILIATEAGAEGLNLQFCSLVINYDLPWNPQLVEQRIGRCHRFGQKYDVVVINYLNSNNIIEQRIYELLSLKFKVFEEVLGTSDTILGNLDDGDNLQKSIIEIYTKCRTVEEINSAFDKIQEKYKEEISESMKKTKEDLLKNFDEDLQKYFSDVMETTNLAISDIEKVFYNLTKCVLSNAKFNDYNYSFTYNNENYCLSTKNDGTFIDYNMNSLLGKKVMLEAETVNEKYGKISFDITNYPYKITSIEKIKNKEGYLILSKLSIDSFEQEEYLLMSGVLNDGTFLDEETIRKLFRLSTKEENIYSVPSNIENNLIKEIEQLSKKKIIESTEKNNQLFNEEIIRINKWADDKIEGTQLEVELMRAQRKDLQKQSDLAENSVEKAKIEEEIAKLSKKIKLSWLNLAEAEEEIEAKRKNMIEKLRKENMKNISINHIFIVKFEII